jgi:hypothetical protein
MLGPVPITCDRYMIYIPSHGASDPPFLHVGCSTLLLPTSTLFYTTNLNLFMETFPDFVAPSLLFISSFVSLILIAFQLSSLHKSQWTIHDAQGIRRLIVLSITLLISFLTVLSATLGLVAHQACRTGNRSLATRATLGGKITIIILQFGRKFLQSCRGTLINRLSLDMHDVSSQSESACRAYTLAIHRRPHLCQSQSLHSSDVFPTRSKYVISLPVYIFFPHTRYK